MIESIVLSEIPTSAIFVAAVCRRSCRRHETPAAFSAPYQAVLIVVAARDGSTASGLEYQRKNSLFYSYYGGVFAGRNTTPDSTGTGRVGYGFDGSPLSHNRTTQEITGGITQTIWRDPKVGALQAMLQYAYLTRNPWPAPLNGPKNAHEHAVYFNLRYTLPGAPPAVR